LATIYDASNMTCRDYAKLTLKVSSELFPAKENFSSIRVPYLSSIAIILSTKIEKYCFAQMSYTLLIKHKQFAAANDHRLLK
jgi:hypothetical protein